jgi:hypothetical protein
MTTPAGVSGLTGACPHEVPPSGVLVRMKLTRWAVLAGVGRKLYGESRKPENQARVRAAVSKLRGRGR